MCCLCAAFCATTCCCSEWALRSALRFRWIAAFDEATCWTMFASWLDVELTVSTRLSRSSKLVEPNRSDSVELSCVEVYAVTRRAASDFCAILRFARARVSCLRFSRRSPSIFCRRTFARLYCSTAAPRLWSIWAICPRTCWACACFAATLPGSALAEAAAHSATTPITNACAYLLPTLTSWGRGGRRARAGGGRSAQVRHPSNDFGCLQPLSEPKTALSSHV